jgi:hypothetical protein
MRTVIVLLGIGFLLMQGFVHLGQSYSVAPAAQLTEKPCGFAEIYKYEGWKIPGQAGSARTKDRYTFPDAEGLTAIRLSPGPPTPNLVVVQCSQDFPGRLIYRLKPVKVLELWQCDFKGKVFAYAGRYELQIIDKGIRRSSLEGISTIFYDIDGSGKFVSMKYQSGLLLKRIQIPAWVK